MVQISKMSPAATNSDLNPCVLKWKDRGSSLTKQFKQAVTNFDSHILSLPQALQEICDFGFQMRHRSIKVN